MKMLKNGLLGLLLMLFGLGLKAQSLDSIPLLNLDSQAVNLGKYKESKALVLVFTGNHCVYSKKYESRLLRAAKEAEAKEIGFVLVNSNDPELSHDDRLALMRERAKANAYPCAYLQDGEGKLADLLGATKNPEVFVLRYSAQNWVLLYSGKIDDNPLLEEKVEHRYLSEVMDRIAQGDFSQGTPVPAVGCNIKK
jgi:thiol-disulfide isomerase/thioredoxin